MNDQVASNENKDARRKWLHRRTILVVLGLVIIPWILIALPGEAKDEKLGELIRNMFGQNSFEIRAQHGWPAIHGTSFKYSRSLPTNFSDKPIEPTPLFDVIRHRKYDERLFSSGFWSEINRWPSIYLNSAGGGTSAVHFEYKTRWAGLAINLSLLVFASLLVGGICEYRIIRLGYLWRFSLAQAICLISLVSGMLAFGSYHFNIEKKQQVELGKLRELADVHKPVRIVVERKEILPSFVSRLFDYRIDSFDWTRPAILPIDCVAVLPTQNLNRNNKEFYRELSQLNLPLRFVGLRFAGAPYDIEGVQFNNVVEFEYILNFKDLKLLNRLKQFPGLRKLHCRLRVPQDGQDLDLSVVDSMSALKTFDFIVNFKSDERQQDHLKEILSCTKLSSLHIESLGQQGAEYLLNEYSGNCTITFDTTRSNNEKTSGGIKEETWQQLIEKDFEHIVKPGARYVSVSHRR